MENKTMVDNQMDEVELQLTKESINYLKEAAKWAKFLSILGFVSVGILAATLFVIGVSFSLSSRYGGMSGATVFITYLIIAAISFISVFFIYKFASNTLKAVETNNTKILSKGLSFIKSYFKFNGILMIIVLSFYILIIIIYMILYAASSVS